MRESEIGNGELAHANFAADIVGTECKGGRGAGSHRLGIGGQRGGKGRGGLADGIVSHGLIGAGKSLHIGSSAVVECCTLVGK